jgi:hypothetical protein
VIDCCTQVRSVCGLYWMTQCSALPATKLVSCLSYSGSRGQDQAMIAALNAVLRQRAAKLGTSQLSRLPQGRAFLGLWCHVMPHASAACCPVNCVGSWVTTGNCTGACSGGAGFLPQRFIITGMALNLVSLVHCVCVMLGCMQPWFHPCHAAALVCMKRRHRSSCR